MLDPYIKIFQLSDKLFQYKLDSLRTCISLSNHVSGIIEGYESKHPFHLNVIEAACRGQFKETGHSRILADMLRHPSIQKSFVEHFLKINYTENMQADVTAEIERIDVALRNENFFIIIENKVNNAVEQKNQVYKYVHDIAIAKHGYKMSQIYVVYLNSTNRDMPSDYSLCDDNGQDNVSEALGKDHFIVRSYMFDVTDWLRTVSVDNEPHVNSALDQYIDYLENKFHISPLDDNMNKEIQNLILRELNIEGKSFNEQIDALNNQCEKINELLAQMENVKKNVQIELNTSILRSWQQDVKSKHQIEVNSDDRSFGIKLKNGVWMGIWNGCDADVIRPYLAFQLDKYRKDENPEIYNTIKSLLEEVQMDEGTRYNCSIWVAWRYTDNGYDDFIKLYNAAKAKNLL